ncbi:MAG TPA: cation:proton antiporter [Euryarchaeota archaeon]|nr:cation:proton antiporter [Euryarchaeota archaeon]
MIIFWAYISAIGLISIGIYGLLMKRHAFKLIISLGLISTGVNLLLISIGYIIGGTAPIYPKNLNISAPMVDPLPQALVLTAIVIETAILAAALSLAILMHREYGTLDVRVIWRRLR